MKRFTRVCLILVGAFAGVGVILAILGAAMGASWAGVRFAKWRDSEAQSGDGIYTFSDDVLAQIDKLDIEIQAGSVQIVPADTEEIRLEVKKSNHMKCTVSGNTLMIKDTVRRIFGISAGGTKVVLYLPQDMDFVEIDISVDAGEVEASEISLSAEKANLSVGAGSMKIGGLTAESELEAEVGAGEMRIWNLNAGQAKLECGLGEMTIAGQISGNVEAECGMGELNITLQESQDNFNYAIECGVGEIAIGGQSYASLGQSRKIDNQAGKNMSLDCGVGTIRVNYE